MRDRELVDDDEGLDREGPALPDPRDGPADDEEVVVRLRFFWKNASGMVVLSRRVWILPFYSSFAAILNPMPKRYAVLCWIGQCQGLLE